MKDHFVFGRMWFHLNIANVKETWREINLGLENDNIFGVDKGSNMKYETTQLYCINISSSFLPELDANQLSLRNQCSGTMVGGVFFVNVDGDPFMNWNWSTFIFRITTKNNDKYYKTKFKRLPLN